MSFLRTMFSSSRAVSFGRGAAAFALVNGCGWVWFVVLKSGTLPDLGGVGGFVVAIGAGTYGLGKVTEAVQAIKGVKDEKAP